MLGGTYQDGVLIEAGGRGQFPLEWLDNTPFSDYTIPALILAIGVGGSSLIAMVMVFTGGELGILASMADCSAWNMESVKCFKGMLRQVVY